MCRSPLVIALARSVVVACHFFEETSKASRRGGRGSQRRKNKRKAAAKGPRTGRHEDGGAAGARSKIAFFKSEKYPYNSNNTLSQ